MFGDLLQTYVSCLYSDGRAVRGGGAVGVCTTPAAVLLCEGQKGRKRESGALLRLGLCLAAAEILLYHTDNSVIRASVNRIEGYSCKQNR